MCLCLACGPHPFSAPALPCRPQPFASRHNGFLQRESTSTWTAFNPPAKPAGCCRLHPLLHVCHVFVIARLTPLTATAAADITGYTSTGVPHIIGALKNVVALHKVRSETRLGNMLYRRISSHVDWPAHCLVSSRGP